MARIRWVDLGSNPAQFVDVLSALLSLGELFEDKGEAKMQDTSSILAGLSTLAAMLAGISVAVERVVEVIKGAIPPLATPWAKNDRVRAAIVQIIAAAVGAIIASQIPEQVRSSLPFGLGAGLSWTGYALIGLMASGGSGAWNHVLDILSALKSKQQAAAQTATRIVATSAAQVPAAAKAAGA